MILAYLALLGATVTYPHLHTLTHLGPQTHRNFFAKFSKFGREKLYPRFVTKHRSQVPRGDEALRKRRRSSSPRTGGEQQEDGVF
ncbi:hypothetical protein BASA81_007601 [Batrachochytrium salamandrivorans]|nr:hypothetical protein BASA81_007601 [Batrachochytrium salamandrivorans]